MMEGQLYSMFCPYGHKVCDRSEIGANVSLTLQRTGPREHKQAEEGCEFIKGCSFMA